MVEGDELLGDAALTADIGQRADHVGGGLNSMRHSAYSAAAAASDAYSLTRPEILPSSGQNPLTISRPGFVFERATARTRPKMAALVISSGITPREGREDLRVRSRCDGVTDYGVSLEAILTGKSKVPPQGAITPRREALSN